MGKLKTHKVPDPEKSAYDILGRKSPSDFLTTYYTNRFWIVGWIVLLATELSNHFDIIV